MIRACVISAAALAVVLSFPAYAEFAGKVIDVADGDTITVLDANQQRHKIRLAGLDAPEREQKLRLWRDPQPVPPWEWRASRK